MVYYDRYNNQRDTILVWRSIFEINYVKSRRNGKSHKIQTIIKISLCGELYHVAYLMHFGGGGDKLISTCTIALCHTLTYVSQYDYILHSLHLPFPLIFSQRL